MENQKFVELSVWREEILNAQKKLKGRADADSKRHYRAHEKLLKKLEGQLSQK